MRWNNHTILVEIRRLHQAGEALNFCAAEENHFHLVRAALWHFGSWKCAVEAAGFAYDSVAKYKPWTREKLLEAIREHHRAGRDLSWRAVSTTVDPSLAAAALRPREGFSSWPEALQAAGLDSSQIARYRRWTSDQIVAEIDALARGGHELSSRLVKQSNQSLFCAAVRHFGSWNQALVAAGLDPNQIGRRRLRLVPSNHRAHSPQNPLVEATPFLMEPSLPGALPLRSHQRG